ncbi:MAG: hypothetical protein DWI29_02840 [Planctomycetota bacterium]|nr:MAG: hypothetical protein DWI29_02840 [Planctomycetota bacterium]
MFLQVKLKPETERNVLVYDGVRYVRAGFGLRFLWPGDFCPRVSPQCSVIVKSSWPDGPKQTTSVKNTAKSLDGL